MHKLRAFIGEPRVFLPNVVFERMFLSVVDMIATDPKNSNRARLQVLNISCYTM